MNRKIALTLIIASAAAGSAFAETPLTGGGMIIKATMTRAEVQAALAQHRQSGVDTFADGYNQLNEFHSVRARADVQAEYKAARDQVAAMNGEDSGARYLTRREPARAVPPQLAALPVRAD
jgi:hypothetical protein